MRISQMNDVAVKGFPTLLRIFLLTAAVGFMLFGLAIESRAGDGNLYVNSTSTNEVLRYTSYDGSFPSKIFRPHPLEHTDPGPSYMGP